MTLESLQRELRELSPWRVACETCEAEAGKPCRGAEPHAPRKRALKEKTAELSRFIEWEQRVAKDGVRT